MYSWTGEKKTGNHFKIILKSKGRNPVYIISSDGRILSTNFAASDAIHSEYLIFG